MPWVRFADDYLSNAKVALLPPLARLLDVSAIIYSARELRDGELSQLDVDVIATLARIPRVQDVAAKLVQAGRWVPTGEGFSIHDYLTYQPSRDQVLRKRAADAERMRKTRSPAERPAERPAEILPESRRSSRVPDPVPDPETKSPSLGRFPARARPPDVAPPRGSPGDPEPPPLRPEQQTCPLCPEVFPDNAALRDHVDNSPRHKVRPVPEDFSGGRKPPPKLTKQAKRESALVAAELAAIGQRLPLDPAQLPPDLLAEHERLLSRERARKAE